MTQAVKYLHFETLLQSDDMGERHSVAIWVGQPPERDQLVHLLINHKHKYDDLRFSFMSGPELSEFVSSLFYIELVCLKDISLLFLTRRCITQQ